MKIRPLMDYMILELVDEQKSSIALPDTVDKTKDDSAIFEVISVGPGHHENGEFITPVVVPGDRVILAGYSIAKITIDRKKVLVARSRDVALIVEKETE